MNKFLTDEVFVGSRDCSKFVNKSFIESTINEEYEEKCSENKNQLIALPIMNT